MMTIDRDFELTKEYDKKYCMQVFAPLEVAFRKGKGVYLYDTNGHKYMDMIGGIAVNTLGHNNKALTSVISKQASELIHCSNYYYIPERSELAFRLCTLSFADKVFFSNSGAEANEGAIKLARGYFYHNGQPNKNEIITAKMSFHGRTMATISATGQDKFRIPFEPAVPGFTYVPFNDFDAIEAAANENTCAIMLELIQGESGVHPADLEYIQKIRKFCNDKGILLIFDEVQTGIGRTGRMFCYEHYNVTPDIMTLAKGLAGGVPIGATLCTNEVSKGFKVGDHGSTFGGNPLACAAGNCVINQITEKDLLSNASEVSSYLFSELTKLQDKYNSIVSVRGKGLLIGIEFREGISAAGMREQLFKNDMLVSAIGRSTIRIAPPLIISISEAKKFISALASVLKAQKKNPLPTESGSVADPTQPTMVMPMKAPN